MQDEREKAVELLKNGKYYDEALKWYNSRYITPKSQLVIMTVFAFVALLAFFISVATTISIFPLSSRESFLIERELKFNEGIVISEIGGTVGDIESLPYVEAIRQVRWE